MLAITKYLVALILSFQKIQSWCSCASFATYPSFQGSNIFHLGLTGATLARSGCVMAAMLSLRTTAAYHSSNADSLWNSRKRSSLIDNSINPLVIGYAHNAKSGKAEQAIRDGANVIIWSFLHLETIQMEEGKFGRSIKTDLDLDEIKRIRDEYESVVHIAAFGGWNGPHPQAASAPGESFGGKEWCHIFMEFNKSHGYIFDGVDWDYEGHDDLTASTSKFTLQTLDIMAEFSVEAKEAYGMIVSMAPAESYLDASVESGSVDEQFSLDLDFPPRAWTSSKYASEEDRVLIQSAGFSHAGRQCYAYVCAKAGIHTFDWISIQLYEAYSPFSHEISRRKLDPVIALMTRINALVEGYKVTGLPSLSSPDYVVKIPPTKLVVGIANRWADGTKFCKVEPSSLRSAYDLTMTKHGSGFLGVMFWTIEEEGDDEASRLTHSLGRLFRNLYRNGKKTTKQNGEL